MDLTPGYLCDGWSVAEVESIEPLKCRVRVYKREIQRFWVAHILTNTHAMTVVVWQNTCGGPVWTCLRDTSVIAGVWRKLTASNQLKCRVRVYKREIQRFSPDHILTNTHAMAVVV